MLKKGQTICAHSRDTVEGSGYSDEGEKSSAAGQTEKSAVLKAIGL